MLVKKGDKVQVHYTGSLDDGKVFDSSEGREPLEFIAGSGQVIAGFDQGTIGMNVGEEKKVTIPPAQAYGEAKEELVIEIPKQRLPANVKPGTVLMFKDPSGQTIPMKIKEVKEKVVTVDLNHPLAGKTLHFKIKVIAIL